MEHALSAMTMPLCHVSDIAEGEAKGFLPSPSARRKIIVLKRNGRLHGWLDSCPHFAGGTPMAWKSNAYLNGDGTHLACHSHGALFEMETGECVLGPCLGQSLTRVNLQVTDAGDVVITEHPGGEENEF
ncbi:nitrite reductase/ring-hydroxylating ferredoxin subunit [Agrobacterium vitis]|nr:nitrite reductase/ring-hydroxylating ferredoxin subunit [Agrobacterium vitis]MBE1437903.1 nitrite reductase/ring-hydroxylating ferredoxin subunit [Agrobacterium vitis]